MSVHKRTRPIPLGAPGHPKQTGPSSGSDRPRKGKYSGPAPKPEKLERREEDAYGRVPRSGPKALPAGRLKGQVDFLYEDRDIIVVEKPQGLPVIAAEGSRAPSLYDVVTERIRRKNPKGRAAVVHRLDRESSGVLVFATSGKIKTILMSHWDEMARERIYWALVEGAMEEREGRLVNWLVEAGPSRMKTVIAGTEGSQKAVTDYRVIAKGGGFSLLELSLETGRKHQIRVQLAAAGHPIAGDERYGAQTDPLGRLCLHAVVLVLEHPSTREVQRFESPAPEGFMEACRPRPKARPNGRGAAPSASSPGAGSAGPRPRKGPPDGKPSPRPSSPRGKPKGPPGTSSR